MNLAPLQACSAVMNQNPTRSGVKITLNKPYHVSVRGRHSNTEVRDSEKRSLAAPTANCVVLLWGGLWTREASDALGEENISGVPRCLARGSRQEQECYWERNQGDLV